jgi:hypothetical protein
MQQATLVDGDRNAVIDGHHRLRVAVELGLTDVPNVYRYGLSEDEGEALARALNDCRRHYGPAELAERLRLVDERRRRVLAQRAASHRRRAIAATEGVSLGQVQRPDRYIPRYICGARASRARTARAYPMWPRAPDSVLPPLSGVPWCSPSR